MVKWIHKKDMPDGNRLEKQTDSGRDILFLPIKIRGRAEKAGEQDLRIYEHRKKYPTHSLIFKRWHPSSSITKPVEALDGKKILVTIEVIS